MGWSGPPFNLPLLASLLGIKERAVSDLPQDALIMPRRGGDGFEILWNDAAPESRRNFTFGHEIAHTFFPDCAESIRYREPLHRCDPQRPVEVLCDLGAAELLLPVPEFREDVLKRGLSLSTIEELRHLYAASREAVARRIVGLDLEPCAVAILSYRLSKTEAAKARQLHLPGSDAPRPKYRVDMMFVSDSFGGPRLPVHKSIPDDSCIYRVAGAGLDAAPTEGTEVWVDGHRRELPRCRIFAASVPPAAEGASRALALMLPVL